MLHNILKYIIKYIICVKAHVIYKYCLRYLKVAPKKELDENDKPNGEKKDAIIIEEKKEAPLATPEA